MIIDFSFQLKHCFLREKVIGCKASHEVVYELWNNRCLECSTCAMFLSLVISWMPSICTHIEDRNASGNGTLSHETRWEWSLLRNPTSCHRDDTCVSWNYRKPLWHFAQEFYQKLCWNRHKLRKISIILSSGNIAVVFCCFLHYKVTKNVAISMIFN